MSRELSRRDLAYESISGDWSSFISKYDTNRRVEVLVDEFLGGGMIEGRTVLDVGCGLGYFTERLRSYRPSRLTATDIAPRLVDQLQSRLPDVETAAVDLYQMEERFSGRTFDVVLCSEVIEHTPDPEESVRILCRLVAPGGRLVLSVPNRRWIWSLHAVQAIGLRKHYAGYENWVRPEALRSWIETAGLKVERSEGIHVVPWQFVAKSLLRAVDRAVRSRSYPWCVNLAIMAVREA